MKPYIIVLISFSVIIFLFILTPFILTNLPCRINIQIINKTSNNYKIEDSEGNEIIVLKPELSIELIGTYDGYYELTSNHKKYIIEYSDKDHWFAMIHREIVTINNDNLDINGSFNWNYQEFDK